jgi:hypothetical protein
MQICKSARPTTMCVIHETQLVFGCENGNLVAVRLNGEGDMNCQCLLSSTLLI